MKNSLNQIPKAYTRSGSDSRALSQKNVNPNQKKASEKSDMSDTMSSKSITQNFLSGVVNTLSKVVNRSQVQQETNVSLTNDSIQVFADQQEPQVDKDKLIAQL